MNIKTIIKRLIHPRYLKKYLLSPEFFKKLINTFNIGMQKNIH